MMGFRALTSALAILLTASAAAGQGRSVADQIDEAVKAAPESMRAGATVLGYGGEEREGDVLDVLRSGTNELVCLADDPAEEGFHSACYHRSLDAFMVLGRRLRRDGSSRSEIMAARYAALESGDLVMPARASLYSVSADSPPDPDGRLAGARRLTVIYIPGATGAELGLPTRPEGDAPWLMLPGTPWAHIMISR